MADTEAQAVVDLTAAVQTIGDAIAGEIAALQAAIAAAQPLPPDHSAAIQAAVTNLNNLTASLKNSVAPPAPVTPTSDTTGEPVSSAPAPAPTGAAI